MPHANLPTDPRHHVWQTRFEEQLRYTAPRACEEFLAGLAEVGFRPGRMPELAQLQHRMKKHGWELIPVEHTLGFGQLLNCWAAGLVPVRRQLLPFSPGVQHYVPDYFSDVFGLLPLLTHPAISATLRELGRLGERYPHPEAHQLLQRFYVHTLQFSLTREGRKLQLFGAQLLAYARPGLDPLEKTDILLLPYHLEDVLATPIMPLAEQRVFFVAPPTALLSRALERIGRLLAAAGSNRPAA